MQEGVIPIGPCDDEHSGMRLYIVEDGRRFEFNRLKEHYVCQVHRASKNRGGDKQSCAKPLNVTWGLHQGRGQGPYASEVLSFQGI
jgi:hypothetical protein